ncbi:hypothetical protein IFU40_05615 [Microbacterium sp. CFBP 13617]|uniref:hypothetical protein n=1 Tax=Microbacterium sp. CFBP 13617 TaxID=2774035 RepID=UPI001780773C|nr:hypothetical protein [Microbacterium sp. CFBP 13617]MBD8218114.1 hypothetical protein [Microbacterium sp. CFBP 13617]
MDSGVAAILAAGITGAVVAATFLAGELIRLARDRAERRAAAVGHVLAALREIPDWALQTLLDRLPFSLLRAQRRGIRSIMDVVTTSAALYGSLPRRDYALVDWVGWKIDALPMEAEPLVERAAEVTAMLMLYLSDRRRALAMVRRPNPELAEWRARARGR